MKKSNPIAALMIALALPVVALAQVNSDFARRAGEREFTLGGGGAANKDFDNTLGGINFSYGQYINDTLMWSLRQGLNYSNPDVGGTQWNGSTKLAFDQHFGSTATPLKPFVGVNIGGVYGDAVRDTWSAGLEAGAKYYVQTRTFVFAMAEYGWFFRKARSLDDRFSDGQFTWNVGVGFNF